MTGSPHAPAARRALPTDLAPLLALFRACEVSTPVECPERAGAIWAEMLGREGLVVLVAEADGTLVATATLVTAPNLLRAGRGHAFLENVVTHPAHRGRGYGRAVVGAALGEAWALGCHHVLLQSGRRDLRVRRFYEGCGFRAGLRAAYAAPRPA